MDILNRFLNYVQFETTSYEDKGITPSNKLEFLLANFLEKELKELGLEIEYDQEHCYLYAVLKGDMDVPSVGFISHMDTSSEVSGKNIKPQMISHNGKTLIKTDGTTLLGADDKAGIAEIMSMLEYFVKTKESHGDIWVAFTPDEEIGEGTKYFDLDKFPVDYAYTVDGKDTGEICYENFNAASINIQIKGVDAHYGYAKGKLVNSQLIAMELHHMVPTEFPENTEGYQGYYMLHSLEGNPGLTTMKYIIRDFDKEKINLRIETIKQIVEQLNLKYGDCIQIEVKRGYSNMKEIIDQYPHVVEIVTSAMKKLQVIPITVPIRGGTDGVELSFMGLPCPNLGTGGQNFHSVDECIYLEDMEKARDILIEIVKEYSRVKDIPRRIRKNG